MEKVVLHLLLESRWSLIMIKKISLIVLLCLILYGCGREDSIQEKKVVFYQPNKQVSDLVKIESNIYKKDFNLNKAIEIINAEAPNELFSKILPDGVTIESFTSSNGIVEINFNDMFLNISPQVAIITKAAIVNLVTNIDNIYGVKFYVSGKEIQNDTTTVYTKRNFLISGDIQKREKKIDAILYFFDSDKSKLVKNISTISYNDYETVEFNIIRELLRGYSIKDRSKMVPVLPSDIRVYEAKTIDGICHIKMNNAIEKLGNERDIKFAVYAIVNSLCSISGIQGVQMYVNNNVGINFNNTIIYNKILTKNESEELVVVPKND